MSDNCTIRKEIEEHWKREGKVWPDTIEAIGWAITEMGEVMECWLAGRRDWVRNNPEDHPVELDKREMAGELGDAIMMLLIAGYTLGYDPLELIREKLR